MPYPNGLSDYERGYVLGLFEGEGFIAFNRSLRPGREKGHEYFTVHIGVANTNLEILKRVQQFTGIGSITEKPFEQKGNIMQPAGEGQLPAEVQ